MSQAAQKQRDNQGSVLPFPMQGTERKIMLRLQSAIYYQPHSSTDTHIHTSLYSVTLTLWSMNGFSILPKEGLNVLDTMSSPISSHQTRLVQHETSALCWESSQSYWLTRLRTLPALLWQFPRAPSDLTVFWRRPWPSVYPTVSVCAGSQ